MMNKIFRLFVSSTFSDFKKEREILQTTVFPKIKKYAAKEGYIFQPIDLRWGVSEEAQLDQKTLELCLGEVKNCKSYPHPNFLTMVGDRYGWVPLPYTIEKDEFEAILNCMNDEERDSVERWYKVDLNELPVGSYMLNERSSEEDWEKEEEHLRDILQKAVTETNIDYSKKSKYFLSATHSEVIVGTEEFTDQYIFGVLRDIDKTSNAANIFIDSDYDKIQNLKSKIRQNLKKENILEIKTVQLDNNTLDDQYIKKFKEKIIYFLKTQINNHIANEKEENLSKLEIEKQEQKKFLEQKKENFLGQEAGLSTVKQYLKNKNKKPLIIYGKSGSGKSSLMAQSINQAKENTKDMKIVYRFVGATEYSGLSHEILASIIEELGIDIPGSLESFEDFSKYVKQEFKKLENVVIFIDAVDQLSNEDKFNWLPEELPNRVKVVISTLDDDNYEADSEYYEILKEKSNYKYEIKPFNENDASNLLEKILQQESRTATKDQKQYFRDQYKKTPFPLFVIIASQIIKNWKSYCEVGNNTSLKKINGFFQDSKNYKCTLSENKGNIPLPGQEDNEGSIIGLFIFELSKKYHHNEKFVKKVLGFISASVDGLSESEILQLLSTDKKLLKELAPEDFHKNHIKEIPIIHWSRLQAQLKPFLRPKIKDNEVLLCFFHREFNNFTYNKNGHEEILKAVGNKIIETKDKKFDSTRWGKLHITLIVEYAHKHKIITKVPGEIHETNMPKELFNFLAFLPYMPIEWQEMYIQYLNNYQHNFNSTISKILYSSQSIQYILLEAYYHLYEHNSEKWCKDFCHTFITVSKFNNSNEKKIEYAKNGLMLAKKYIGKNQTEVYAYALLNMIDHYYSSGDMYKGFYSINFTGEYRNLTYGSNLKREVEKKKEVYKKLSDDNNLKNYINSILLLSDFNKCKKQRTDETRKFLKNEFEAIGSKLEKLFGQNRPKWAKYYMRNLAELAYIYLDEKDTAKLRILKKTVKEIKGTLKCDSKNIDFIRLHIDDYNLKKDEPFISARYQKSENEISTLILGKNYYSIFLKEIVSFYRYSGQLEKALRKEKDTSTLEKWAYQYQENGEYDKEIVVRKTILETKDPNKVGYLQCIHKLMKATYYNKQFIDVIKLGEEALNIADRHYAILIK